MNKKKSKKKCVIQNTGLVCRDLGDLRIPMSEFLSTPQIILYYFILFFLLFIFLFILNLNSHYIIFYLNLYKIIFYKY